MAGALGRLLKRFASTGEADFQHLRTDIYPSRGTSSPWVEDLESFDQPHRVDIDGVGYPMPLNESFKSIFHHLPFHLKLNRLIRDRESHSPLGSLGVMCTSSLC